ncbi:hypothetical protein [Salinibaculum salinum]|uniref:hypothetical protein n=1 Tax=Salinibaculum salinum TaxID=3131996 RepID=UPI0030EC4467
MGRQSYTGYSDSDRRHVNTHKHPEPLIPRNQIRGVRERIDIKGNQLVPLYEDDVRAGVNDLLDQDVDDESYVPYTWTDRSLQDLPDSMSTFKDLEQAADDD